LSGVQLVFFWEREDRAKTTASLDRIDSTKGYTLDNIQWVHKTLNRLKMNLDNQEFIEWCKKLRTLGNPNFETFVIEMEKELNYDYK